MADILTELEPIVLDLKDRGLSAIDYIDYFDEGLYGPDKPYFVARFKKLSQVAEQIDKCLALQTTEGSLIHHRRAHIPDKWIEPLVDKDEPYPQRAQYAIRFMLRIRFYGDFAYLDIGRRWKPGDIEAAANGTLKISGSDLEVINKCWLSDEDATKILLLLKGENDGLKLPYTIKYDGSQKYDPETASVTALTAAELEAIENAELEATAVYLTDGESVLGDAEGALNIA
jgi:hypothetical protein